jgi:hypothetical protein
MGLRLEIPVDHLPVVGEGHALADLEEHPEKPRQVVFRRGRRVLVLKFEDDGFEGFALHPLHGEVVVAVGSDARVVGRGDGGMVELAGDPHLVEEAAEEPGVALAVAEGDLHGYVSFEGGVLHTEDPGHAPAADLADDFVVPRRGFFAAVLGRFRARAPVGEGRHHVRISRIVVLHGFFLIDPKDRGPALAQPLS